MKVIETFGRTVDSLSEKRPAQAASLLKMGWEAQNLKNRFRPDKRLFPSDQYLAKMMMDAMLKPLKKPEETALISMFTPSELMQEVGLSPYNVESFSCYLTGTRAERGFLQCAEDCGISETLCSYHKTFLGAAQEGLMPKPKCIVYTTLACDANLVTFNRLAELYKVPSFCIDVPLSYDPEDVSYVAGQLRDLAAFLEQVTGRTVREDALRERLARSRRTLLHYEESQDIRSDRYVPTDLVTPFYAGIASLFLLGTPELDRYNEMRLADARTAPPARGIRLYWLHTIPFWSQPLKDALIFSEKAQIVGCEFAQTMDLSQTSDDPYEEIALRLLHNTFNGSVTRRIESGIRNARRIRADGAVWFCHWGCKHTLGGAQLAKKKFEEAGIPLLILDGDGCDTSHGGEGQTATRLGAFLEMLEEKRHE